MSKPPLSNDGIPKRCSNCRSRHIDVELMPSDDWVDGELAVDCGFDENDCRDEFHYINAHAECNRCGEWWSYGPRWYFNSDTGQYDRTRDDVLRLFGVLEDPINDPALYDRPLL